ncbi:MAG: RHS repeat protein [Acidimicrobiales bacterium]|nr:RHS repeat protein [Acidimicrobiales bacterium]
MSAQISGDAKHIVFVTAAAGVVPGMSGGSAQVYRASRASVGGAWSFELVSKNDAGDVSTGVASSQYSLNGVASISEDGSRVAWLSEASNLEPGVAPDGTRVLAVRDIALNKTRVAVNRHDVTSAYPIDSASLPMLSPDGERVALMIRAPSPAGTDRVLLFDASHVLSDDAAVRTDLVAASRKTNEVDASNPAVASRAGGYNILFSSYTGPLDRYEGSPPSLYLVGGKGFGSPVNRAWHADPVDTYSGAFSQTDTDLAPVAGPAAATLTRSYLSQSDVRGWFGAGWTTPFEATLELGADDNATLTLPGGRAVGWWHGDDGSWSTSSGFIGQLVDVADGFVLRSPEGSEMSFDSTGTLTGIHDKGQPAVTVSRISGDVVVSSADGFQLTLVDDQQLDPETGEPSPGQDGLVDRAESSDGFIVDYAYSATSGAVTLASASRPHRSGELAASVGRRRYWWSGTLLTKVTDDVDATRTDVVVENTYDGWGRVVSQISDEGDVLSFHYGQRFEPPAGLVDADGYTTVVNEASGDHVVYHYGLAGELLGVEDTTGHASGKTWFGDLATSNTSRSGVKTETAYDAAGRPTMTTETVGGTSRTVAAYEYVVAATDPAARSDSRLSSATDAAGVETTFEYSSAAGTELLPWKTSVPCDAISLAPGEQCPASGRSTVTTTYWTGALDGLVKSSVDADGVRTESEYWPDRSLKSRTTFPEPGVELRTEYETLRPGDAGFAETDSGAARVERMTSPGGALTETVFNAAGQVIESRDPLFDGAGHGATRYTYWLDGSPKTVTTPGGHTTTFDLLRPGDPGWTEPAGSDVAEVAVTTDPDGVSTITKTDRSGDVVAVQVGDKDDPASLATTVNTYGPLGRMETSTDPAGVVTRYGYDIEGRQTQVTVGAVLGDPAHTTTTEYDANGRVVSVFGPSSLDPSGVSVRSEQRFTYDAAGRMRTRIDGASSEPAAQLMTSFHYDGAGRLWRTVEHVAGELDPVDADLLSSGDRVAETRFTLAGRMAAELSAPQDVQVFDWLGTADSAKRITKFEYDGAGRQTAVVDAGNGRTETDFDEDGRVARVTSVGLRERTFEYDAAGHRVGVTTPSPTGSGTVTAVTGYTADGQVASQSDPHVVVAGVTDPSTRFFEYTPGGRLHKVTDALENEATYGYDARGNRSSRTAVDDDGNPVVESWVYDKAGRLESHTA